MNRIPPKIKRIFDKPGGEWANAERSRIIEWLFEPQQRGYLLFKGLHYLGTPQNVEDAWGEFCLKRLDQKIDKYDPAKRYRFWSYLLMQFQYFCLDESKKLERRTEREGALVVGKDEEGQPIELELVDKSLTAQEIMEEEGLLKALGECVTDLTSRRQDTVVLFYSKELSIEETALELGVMEGAVKGRLHHARHNLRDCLKGKGWLS